MWANVATPLPHFLWNHYRHTMKYNPNYPIHLGNFSEYAHPAPFSFWTLDPSLIKHKVLIPLELHACIIYHINIRFKNCLQSRMSINQFRNIAITFNAYIFDKCLVTHHFIHLLEIIEFINSQNANCIRLSLTYQTKYNAVRILSDYYKYNITILKGWMKLFVLMYS